MSSSQGFEAGQITSLIPATSKASHCMIKLPTELMQEIFINVMNFGMHPPNKEKLFSFPTQPGTHPKRHHPDYIRWCFSSVCKTWKSIVLSTPQLWSRISLDRRLKRSLPLLDQAMTLSGVVPLEFHISCSKWWALKCPQKDCQDDLHKLQSCVSPHIYRIRTLCMLTHTSDDDMPINFEVESIFLSGQAIHMPFLETYRLSGAEAVQKMSGAIHAPTLISLSLSCIENNAILSFTPQTISHLIHLDLKFKAQHDFSELDRFKHIQALTQCCNLQTLCWHDNYQHPFSESLSLPPTISMPKLISMDVGIVQEDYEHFLRKLDTPALQFLSFAADTYDSSEDIEIGLHAFIRHPFPQLTHIRLDHVDLNHYPRAEYLNLFGHVENLTTLELRDCHINSEFFSAFINTASSPPAVCPRLATLVLDDCSWKNKDLASFIYARVPLEKTHSDVSHALRLVKINPQARDRQGALNSKVTKQLRSAYQNWDTFSIVVMGQD